MALPMKGNVSTYKPGCVSSSLFGSKKGLDTNASIVAELFSPHKRKPSLQQHEVEVKKKKSREPSSSAQSEFDEQLKQDGNQGRPKKKVKKKSEEGQVLLHSPPQTPKEVPAIKDSDGDVNSFALSHHMTQRTSKTTAKKRKDQAEDEEETFSERIRKYRHRDKTNDRRTIFIGNCPLSTDKKILKTLFGKFGAIETLRFRCAPAAQLDLPRRAVVITKNFHEQSSAFVAFVVFKEEEAAQKALTMNGHLLNGLHLRVDLASQSKKHDKKRSIFLGNLPFDVKEEDLRAHFEDCGDIINVRVIRDRRTSLGKGIAYIQFESKDSVSLALKLDNTEFKGRPVRVRVCTNNPEKMEERKSKKTDSKSTKPHRPAASTEAKKMSFAPSNATSTSFQSILKTKKEKRLRKIKKKRENAKKNDGLTSVFGGNDKKRKQPREKKLKGKHNIKGSKGKKREKGSKVASHKFQRTSKKSKKS